MPSSEPNTLVVLVVWSRYERWMSAAAILIGDTASTVGQRSRIASASSMVNAFRLRRLSGSWPANAAPGRNVRM